MGITPAMNLERLFRPASVAIVGASPRPDSFAYQVRQNLASGGFGGRAYLVNGRHRTVGGEPCYSSLAEIGESVDLVLVLVPARSVVPVVEEAAAINAGAAVVFSAGFSESGGDGAELQAGVRRVGMDAGLPIVGPNCVGIVSRPGGLNATFGASVVDESGHEPGLAIVSQSGAVGTIVARFASEAGLARSYLVNSGNEAVLDLANYLRWFSGDPDVGAIFVYAEEIRRGRDFLKCVDHCREVGQQVVVLCGGRHQGGARAARSHTGSIAGEHTVRAKLLAQAGALVVESPEEAVGCLALSKGRYTSRLRVVASSGGTGVLASDLAEDNGLLLSLMPDEAQERLANLLPTFASARNPIDVTPGVYNDVTAAAAVVGEAVRDSEDTLVICSALPGAASERFATATAATLKSMKAAAVAMWFCGSPEIADSYRNAGIPYFADASLGFRCLGLVTRQRGVSGPRRVPPPVPAINWCPTAGSVNTVVTEDVVSGELAKAGLPVVPHRVANSATEARAAAQQLGVPVAIKVLTPVITHRAKIGAVKLHVEGGEAVEAAYNEVIGRAREVDPAAATVLVQAMESEGSEFYVGLKRDHAFGLVLIIGKGGIDIETGSQRTFTVAPAQEETLVELLTLELGQSPGVSVGSLAAVAASVSTWASQACGLANLEELDLNPVIVNSSGAHIVDALAIVKATSDRGTST